MNFIHFQMPRCFTFDIASRFNWNPFKINKWKTTKKIIKKFKHKGEWPTTTSKSIFFSKWRDRNTSITTGITCYGINSTTILFRSKHAHTVKTKLPLTLLPTFPIVLDRMKRFRPKIYESGENKYHHWNFRQKPVQKMCSSFGFDLLLLNPKLSIPVSLNHQKKWLRKKWNRNSFKYSNLKARKKLLWKSVFSLRIQVLDGEIHRLQKLISSSKTLSLKCDEVQKLEPKCL